MQGARYFRAQAELCLDIARQMSDGTVAEGLRDKAAQHFARAVESEAQSGPPPPVSEKQFSPSTQRERFPSTQRERPCEAFLLSRRIRRRHL